MLGVAGGEGYPIGLKFFVDPVGANIMADAYPDVDRTSGQGYDPWNPYFQAYCRWPLQQFCTTVQTVIPRGLCVARSLPIPSVVAHCSGTPKHV